MKKIFLVLAMLTVPLSVMAATNTQTATVVKSDIPTAQMQQIQCPASAPAGSLCYAVPQIEQSQQPINNVTYVYPQQPVTTTSVVYRDYYDPFYYGSFGSFYYPTSYYGNYRYGYRPNVNVGVGYRATNRGRGGVGFGVSFGGRVR